MPKDVVSRDFTINLHKRLFNMYVHPSPPSSLSSLTRLG
jgi:hypothetical protein